jgi:hypothetical protein
LKNGAGTATPSISVSPYSLLSSDGVRAASQPPTTARHRAVAAVLERRAADRLERRRLIC